MKINKNKKHQGNSYIMVVATLSFLAVLVAAILVAVALCYRLRAYNLNSRDNFYYLEQAMDEIYAGVGSHAMGKLNEAYDETVEVIVYFDTATKAYVTMDNDQANELLQNYFVKKLKEDSRYATANVTDTLKKFLSNPYSSSNPSGIQLSVKSNVQQNDDGIVIKDLILKREASYSTVNSAKSKLARSETFVQTISTDLVVSKPEFKVNFNTIGADLNTLYKFAMIADMGVEINGVTTDVNISGNIYAASDFYNKDYNSKSVTVLDAEGNPQTIDTKLHAYNSDTLKKFNGVNENSMYSGFYINGSDVIIASERMIIPGTLAVMNGGTLNVSGVSQSVVSATELWADNITLGGYSFKDATDPEKFVGASASMRANAYISDDLELNAAGSEFLLNGQYYGYNYASKDNRTYAPEALQKAAKRTFVSAVPDTIKNNVPTSQADGKLIGTQAHYNSSAVIVNGADSTLDLSKTTAMYVAGQSYIEMSKKTTSVNTKVNNKKEVTDGSNHTTSEEEMVETYSFGYTAPTDANGNEIADYQNHQDDVKDNYSTDNNDKSKRAIEDYRTGEAISVKSNQLAYIPNWTILPPDENGNMYVQIPERLKNQKMFSDIWANLDKVPVVKTVISGKTYYYFDFSEMSTKSDADALKINDFIAEYSKLVNQMELDSEGKETDVSHGVVLGLTDIGDYSYFKINSLRLHGDMSGSEENNNEYSVYTNSAISVKEAPLSINDNNRVTIKAKSSNMKALLAAAERINAAENARSGNEVSGKDNPNGINTSGILGATTSSDQQMYATNISTKLQTHYLEMKWLLTNTSRDAKAVNEAHTLPESELTPINHYFNYTLLDNTEYNNLKVIDLPSHNQVWICGNKENVVIDSGADLKGVIICKGDVTFADNVKSFQGLIVTGGKIIVNHSMDFTANEEIVKTVLRDCDESQEKGQGSTENYDIVVKLFKQYNSLYKEETPGSEIEVDSAKSIAAVQIEDILSKQNFMKNVD